MIAVPHMMILLVTVPLAAAALVAMFRRGRVAWLLTLLVSWFTFALSLALLAQVLAHGSVSYHIGNWPPPLGIEYRLDEISAFVLLIVAGINALALSHARLSIAAEIEEPRQNLFYTAWLLCLAGLLGVVSTGDAFNIFVFLEISSLASYVLVAAGARSDRRALPAAYNYLILGTVGATFFVIGVGLLYMMTGTLNLADMAERVRPLADNRAVHAGFGFILVGMGLKLAMFPMHTWLPNAYTYAPGSVTVFLAATATKVSVYVMLRFFFTIFGPEYDFVGLILIAVIAPLGVLGMVCASIAAIYQVNLKRLLAYSSIAQIGYILLGMALGNVAGLTATVLHLFNHALMKGALFMALAGVALRIQATSIESVRGLAHRMPWTFAAIAAGGLSLIGIPGTVGFISKWYLIQGSIEAGWWPVTGLIVASSLLAVIYMWRIIEAAWLTPPPAGRGEVHEVPLEMLVPLWVLIGANVYFGINTELTVGIAQSVAETFLGLGSSAGGGS